MEVSRDEWEGILGADKVEECEMVLKGEFGDLYSTNDLLRELVRVNPPRIMAYVKKELGKVRDVRVRWYGLLVLACQGLNKDLVEEILGEVCYEGNELVKPLYDVSWEGDVELVQLLISKGAPVNGYQYESRERVYQMDSRLDLSPDVVAILVKNPSKRMGGGDPLEIASFNGNVEVVKVLLSYGANVNAVDPYKRSALHRASSKGHVEVVKVLLSYGADVNAVDPYRKSALHEASSKGHVEVVKVLLSHGADVNAVYKGATPLFLSHRKNHKDIVDLLISEGGRLIPSYGIDHTAFILDEKN